MRRLRSAIAQIWPRAAILALLVLAWWAVYATGFWNRVLLPAPLSVWRSLWSHLGGQDGLLVMPARGRPLAGAAVDPSEARMRAPQECGPHSGIIHEPHVVGDGATVVAVPLRFQDPDAAWVVQFRAVGNTRR